MKKSTIIIAILLVVAVAVAAAIAVVFMGKKGTSTDTQSNGNSTSSNNNNSASASALSNNVSDSDLLTPTTGKNSTPTTGLTSDPETDPVALTFLAVGDWGGTTGKDTGNPGSCCKLYKSNGKLDTTQPRYKVDFYAQQYVATLMGQSAAQIKPLRVLGHGDNIYWDGAGPKDIAYRMQTTFEEVYKAPSLQGVKWVNVAGNHDIGGSEFICGDSDNNFRECTSIDEMVKYLNLKFDLQAQYKSPNADRFDNYI